MSNPTPWRVEVEPWKKKFDENTGEQLEPRNYFWVRDAKGGGLSVFVGANGSPDHKLAILLAAAPEMLEALQTARDLIHADTHMRDTWFGLISNFDKVLAKATGGAE